MYDAWVRPALRTAQARRDFHDLVALCALPAGDYEVRADEAGTVVRLAGTHEVTPAAKALLDRAYDLAVGDRPTGVEVRYEQQEAPPPRPGGREQFVEIAPGLFGGRAALADLLRRLDNLFLGIAEQQGATEVMVPHLIPWQALQRAGYVSAFPQHLTACYSMRRDLDTVDRLAQAERLVDAAALLEPQEALLAPAACYHLYPLLAGTAVTPDATYTLVASCSRRELHWTPQPIRFWAFRMREIVYLGPPTACVRFRDRQLETLEALARAIGLPCRLTTATDPFYTSTRAGQVSLQNLLDLKYELIVRDAEGNEFAAASVNLHRQHLAAAFDLTSGGRPAHSSCVGMGLERWAYWILSHCGPDPEHWPEPLRQPTLWSARVPT